MTRRGSCTRGHGAGVINKQTNKRQAGGTEQSSAGVSCPLRAGMLLTGLADTEENVWKMNDARYSGLSPRSVVAVAQTCTSAK